MKKIQFFLILGLVTVMNFTACKPKDSAIQAEAQKLVSQGITVSVEKGVLTLTGECKDDACKSNCENAIKGLKGVKSVVNNCTVTPPPAPAAPEVEVPKVSEVESKVMDALKDFPTVKYTLTDGGINLSGEVAKAKLQVLMESLNGLNLKVNSKDLVKK